MSWFQAILLGLVQGLTEFIPVSSTGHLVLFPAFLGHASPPLIFDVAVHLGTLVSAIVYYRKDVVQVIGGLGRMLAGIAKGDAKRLFREDPWARLGCLLAVGTLPTAAIALGLRGYEEKLVTMPVLAAGCLLITGTMLIITNAVDRKRTEGKGTDMADSKPSQAAVIGVAQGIAILPGISRSGSCVIAGILFGLEREFAVKFAFLLMIPAVLGAAAISAIRAFETGVDTALLSQAMVGAVVAMVSGLGAIWIVVKAVQKQALWAFGAYCLVVGTVGLVFLWQQGGQLAGVN